MYKYLISLKIYYLFLVCPIPMNELQQYTANRDRDLEIDKRHEWAM